MHIMTGDGILGPRDTELDPNPLPPDYQLVGPMVGKAEEAQVSTKYGPLRVLLSSQYGCMLPSTSQTDKNLYLALGIETCICSH